MGKNSQLIHETIQRFKAQKVPYYYSTKLALLSVKMEGLFSSDILELFPEMKITGDGFNNTFENEYIKLNISRGLLISCNVKKIYKRIRNKAHQNAK